ncbi:hypothetical protein CC86DRAFT_90722 [Ophiobolus disseminans]|uniref:Uncharacterized protein n=1 Tax=Ophiobolus disseminans TaxID=1469910 RepID=A0A6A7AHU6_9PLEO|nr:hypothetical protein CC86DRAFT_90722 [Ophiobolus disseminans]
MTPKIKPSVMPRPSAVPTQQQTSRPFVQRPSSHSCAPPPQPFRWYNTTLGPPPPLPGMASQILLRRTLLTGPKQTPPFPTRRSQRGKTRHEHPNITKQHHATFTHHHKPVPTSIPTMPWLGPPTTLARDPPSTRTRLVSIALGFLLFLTVFGFFSSFAIIVVFAPRPEGKNWTPRGIKCASCSEIVKHNAGLAAEICMGENYGEQYAKVHKQGRKKVVVGGAERCWVVGGTEWEKE